MNDTLRGRPGLPAPADTPFDAVIALLGADPRGKFRCLLHDDQNPSAQIWLDADGRPGVKCYAGCDSTALRRAIFAPRERRPAVDWRITHTYRQPDGRQVQSLRFDWPGGLGCPHTTRRKDRTYAACTDAGPHKHCAPGQQGRPAANLPVRGLLVALLNDREAPVIVAEGEKAAQYIADAGMTAACWYGGSESAQHANYAPLAGRHIILWPDDDDAGRRAMDTAGRMAVAAGAVVDGVIPTAGDTGNDAADCALSELPLLIAGAESWTPPDELPPDELPPHGAAFTAGEWYAGRIAGRWLYDPAIARWYRYDGIIWTDPPEPERAIQTEIAANRGELGEGCATDTGRDDAGAVFTDTRWQQNQSAPGDFMRALYHTLAGELPTPPEYLLNTPDGEIDLRDADLVLRQHNPASGHRAVTAGRYRPEMLDELRPVLEERLMPVLTHDQQTEFVRLVALALSGLAQTHRAITLLTGASGSGKGGSVNLVQEAFGGYAVVANAAWLEQRRGDIDATAAEFIYRKPRVIVIDELGNEAKIAKNRLNTLTGDVAWTARRPYQTTPYTGKVSAAIWTTAVAVPTLDVGDGVERRLAVLRTRNVRLSAGIRQQAPVSQDLMDALITMAVAYAPECYRADYEPPAGDDVAKAEALADMDEIRAWLYELDEEHSGKTVAEILTLAQQEVGDWVTETFLGRKIRQVPERWFAKRGQIGGVQARRLYLQRQQPF